MIRCLYCSQFVCEDRVSFLNETNKEITCLKCSQEKRLEGFMDYGHKTAPQLVIVPENEEVKRIAKRAFRRAR